MRQKAAEIVALGSSGGAAKRIAKKRDEDIRKIDSLCLLAERFGIDITELRNTPAMIENDAIARPSF
jgi:hypothetical protein